MHVKINLTDTWLHELSKSLLKICETINKKFHYFSTVYYKKGPCEERILRLVYINVHEAAGLCVNKTLDTASCG